MICARLGVQKPNISVLIIIHGLDHLSVFWIGSSDVPQVISHTFSNTTHGHSFPSSLKSGTIALDLWIYRHFGLRGILNPAFRPQKFENLAEYSSFPAGKTIAQ